MKNDLPSIKILGVKVNNASKNEVLEYIFKRLQNSNDKFYIVTPNPEMLVYASRSSLHQDLLNSAEVSLADGVGLLLAGSMLKKGKITRLTGVDMLYAICEKASKDGFTVGFLGGKGGVAEKTVECLTKKYPNLIVSFVGEEWPTDLYQVSSIKYQAKKEIHNTHIDILFVAFGFPKQEEWIAKNLSKIDVSCAMGVGGAFDYISGKVPRAPKIIRDIGMEWAFRLAIQPWRIKRQLSLPVFMYQILKERILLQKT